MDKLRLPHDGQEYLTFSVSGLPASGFVLEAQVAGDPAWYPLDASNRLLVCGPDLDAALKIAGAITVATDGPIRLRVRDTPEVVVRGAGYIALAQ